MKKIILSLLLLFFQICILSAQPSDQFQKVEIVSGLKNAVDFSFLPDGRILLLDRFGEVILYKADLQTTVTAALIPVYHELEDGLLGIEPDPNFQSTQHVFVHYSPLDKSVNRVSRFTMVGDVFDMDSEVVLLEWGVQRESCCHAAGDIEFDKDGNLYIATGDNTNHTEYTTINETDSLFSAERTSANTMDMRGKILRIKPEPDGSYSIPPGNLFPNGQGGLPEIFVMGTRNPYSLHSDEKTGWLFWGEVGPDAAEPDPLKGPLGYDEINLVKEAGNLGWPYLSGKNKPYWNPYENKWYDANAPKNHSKWNTGAEDLPVAEPAWMEIPSECHMVGQRYYYDPEVVDDKKLPIEFDGAFFYFDFNTHWHNGKKVSMAWVVKMDDTGNIISNDLWNPTKIYGQGFIRMKIGPDDHLYILEYGTGCCDHNSGTGVLVRLDYVGVNSNLSPIAKISADNVAGSLPLTVNFSSEGSYDPDGPVNDLSYEWDFDSDGNVDATHANPQHTYTVAGKYTAKLKVKDKNDGESVKLLTIHAGNNFAEFTFDYPTDGAFFTWNENIPIKVAVSDVEDGSTSGGEINCSDVSIVPSLGHLDHTHDDNTINDCEGEYLVASGDHDIDGGDDLYFVFYVNYTDQDNLTSYDQVIVHPKRQELEFYNEQSGVRLLNNTDPWVGGLKVVRASHNSYVMLEERNLFNMNSATFRVASVYDGGTVELRADSEHGTLLASANVPNTGSTDVWENITVPVTDPGGKHNLYFVFKNNSVADNIFDINYVEFSGSGVSQDNVPPGIIEVVGKSRTNIHVRYWEPVDKNTAETLGNYAINNGLTLQAAALQADGKTVILTTTEMGDEESYTLTVNNIKDFANNVIPANTQKSFIYNKPMTPLIRINSGGLAGNFNGEEWVADQYYSGVDKTYSNIIDIQETNKDELYQTERWGDFSYNIPVPIAGEYRVVLHFAELYHGVENENGEGERVFNVEIENGQATLSNFDILSETAPATALIKTFNNIQVSDGILNISFNKLVNNPKLSGVEVYGDKSILNPPSVTILSPEYGSYVLPDFELTYEIENWEVKKGGTHYHWIIDGLNMGGVYQNGPIAFKDMELGEHTIRLELYNANHTGTGIYDDVKVHVVEQLPTSIFIDSPEENSTTNSSFDVAFTVHSFTMPDEGYIQWSLDNGAETGSHSNTNPISFSNISQGEHTLKLELMNVDGTSTGQSDIVQFEVIPELAIGHWNEGDEAEHHRVDVPNAVYNDKLYVFGGLDQVTAGQPVVEVSEAFDPRAALGNQWMVMATMPTPVHHAMALEADGEIWILCGFTESNWGPGTNKVQIYHPETNTWREGPEYPHARGSVGFVRLGRKLHGISGLKGVRHGSANVEVKDHYVLDLDKQEEGWQPAAEIPVGRNHIATIALGGKIYAIGGAIGHDDVPQPWQDQSRVDMYDPYTDSWTEVASLPLGVSHHESSSFAMDGKIVVVAGKTTGNWAGLDEIREYNPDTNEWKVVGEVPVSRLNPASKVIGDTLIITEGGGAIKIKNTYYTKVTRYKRSELGFWPKQMSFHSSETENGTIEKNLILWTYTGNTSFTLEDDNLPDWLTVNVPQYQTGIHGADIGVTLDTTGMAPGNYSYALKAVAEGYDTATIFISMEVEDPYEPSISITSPKEGNTTGLSMEVAFEVENWYIGMDSSHISWVLEELNTNNDVLDMQTGMHMSTDPVLFEGLKHGSKYRVRLGLMNADHTSAGYFDDVIFMAEDQSGSVRINIGGSEVETVKGIFMADNYFTGGTTHVSDVTIANATAEMQEVYQTERWGEFNYEIPVENGAYKLVLHFAELYWGVKTPNGEGKRIFNVTLEGNQVLSNYDIVADVGPATAVVKNFYLEITDGTVNISTQSIVNNAKISAIEIIKYDGSVIISKIDDQSSFESESINFPIVVQGETPLNFMANGLPPGLSINATTGLINGTIQNDASEGGPNNNGIYPIEIFVSNDKGTDIAKFTWRVNLGPKPANTVLYRLNVGGGTLSALDNPEPDWQEDSEGQPSDYLVFVTGKTFSDNGTIDMSHASLQGLQVPASLFNSERYDNTDDATNIQWSFPVYPGTIVKVRVYFAELYAGITQPGQRVFDIEVEGVVPNEFNDIDPFEIAGSRGGFMLETTSQVSADGLLDIALLHDVIENPSIKGIEIIVSDSDNVLPVANAGSDVQMYLPENSIVLIGSGQDSDGNIVSYEWNQLMGPTSITLSGENTATLTVSDMVEGVYEFELTVTDDKGGQGKDKVTVTVIEPVVYAPGNVKATQGTLPEKVEVNWNASANATHYKIYRAEVNSSSSASAISNWIEGTTYMDEPVEANKNFYYFVKGATGESGEEASVFSTGAMGYAMEADRAMSLKDTLNFGDVAVNDTSTKLLKVKNEGNASISVNEILFPEGYSGNWNSGVIGVGETAEITIEFAPIEQKEYNGTIEIVSNADGAGKITVIGKGVGVTAINSDDLAKAITVYPNPSEGEVYLKIESSTRGDLSVEVMDVSGKVLTRETMKKEGEVLERKLSVSHLPKGIYLIKIELEKYFTVKKLIRN
ncbi:malectin domain-containing carbohydrate-binding protein [Rapidithrix thailandica]|uniref:Malectin domain-containing carbohydrate-binding protein n=1 Tax=Rapidithrix thailandica TaxID=413964 RepID=A0AAW9RS65_9BACT